MFIHSASRFAQALRTTLNAACESAGYPRASAAVRLQVFFRACWPHSTATGSSIAWSRCNAPVSPPARSCAELADRWLDLHDLADDDLLIRLRECAFDIVIDLAGHSTGNRIRVLAQRVAPIQLCWLDYFDTTAITAMDGWISDAWLTPDDSPQRYSERLLRLPSGRFCYTPPPDAPACGRRRRWPTGIRIVQPAGQAQRRTSSTPGQRYFAACRKRNWNSALPCSATPLARARTIERFGERGVDAGRLRLQPERSYATCSRPTETWILRSIHFRSPAARQPVMRCGWVCR
jgi:hypothetical protein